MENEANVLLGSKYPSEDKSERVRDVEDMLARQEKEMRECVRMLIRTLAARDEVLQGSRRAFQQLNCESKTAIQNTLKKLVLREKEALAARQAALDKLEIAVDNFDVSADETNFITSHADSTDSLLLCSQAFSILGDIHLVDKQNQELESIASNGLSTPINSPTKNSNGLVTSPMPSETSLHNVNLSANSNSVDNISVTSTEVSSNDTALRYLSVIFYVQNIPEDIIACGSDSQSVLQVCLNYSNKENSHSTDQYNTNECKIAVKELALLSDTLDGRKGLVTILNQFRSTKVVFYYS